MNVNYEYYKIFYYVAKYQNFTKAARALNNSQPNVTRAMNNLEQEINCTLFVRTNRGVFLTPEGEKLYQRVAVAMTQLQLAEEEMEERASLEYGSISIGVSEIALNIFLLEKLKKFHMTYPGVRLKIRNYLTPQALRAVREGEIDFAIVTSPVIVETPLKQIAVKEFQEILVGGSSFSALAEQKLSFADMSDRPMICLGKNTATYHFYEELFLHWGISIKPEIEAATADQVLALAKNELGLAFLPEEMAQEAIHQGQLISVPIKETIPKRSVCMVYDEKRPTGAAAQKLKRMLVRDLS